MSEITTAEDLATYLRDYPEAMALSDADPADVLDRHHTPDLVWVTDGTVLDRDRLIAHARPARRNARSSSVEVHDAIVDGSTVAARYTMRVGRRKGPDVVVEVVMLGHLAPDGRLRRIDQLTRSLDP
ncbi:nuclear transport factor 2 family protein [Iamia sp. SCSIO 61187]|uniref:nuclear transport factor 2 family protein n=1 Tax=Iamia sp. SCSIO 61187 TaxID=2722752 RepID=UPI001C63ABEF|nr:nuclear transport factor 2 family protein [Iamia sp. SCSIO 61187]QYG91403.1 nuclear transport factor 2 family protein [Iamia sp. SCSIO 61187]